MAEQTTQVPAPQAISIKEFLENSPPGRVVSVKELIPQSMSARGATSWPLLLPIIELHCDTESCNGIRFFEPVEKNFLNHATVNEIFVKYRCRNCKKQVKTYALWVNVPEGVDGALFKYGEFPFFGPPTPAKVISILGKEREYYLKGRRSENQGLGIAAFAYYRRAVENQKDKILDEIIRVSEKIGASKEVIEELYAAKTETQFSKALAAIKHGIPQALLVNGHNPLTLLHSALSEGLHAQSDEQCLELATSIRVILTDLVDRLTSALKEEAELNAAVNRLLSRNAAKPNDTNPRG